MRNASDVGSLFLVALIAACGGAGEIDVGEPDDLSARFEHHETPLTLNDLNDGEAVFCEHNDLSGRCFRTSVDPNTFGDDVVRCYNLNNVTSDYDPSRQVMFVRNRFPKNIISSWAVKGAPYTGREDPRFHLAIQIDIYDSSTGRDHMRQLTAGAAGRVESRLGTSSDRASSVCAYFFWHVP